MVISAFRKMHGWKKKKYSRYPEAFALERTHGGSLGKPPTNLCLDALGRRTITISSHLFQPPQEGFRFKSLREGYTPRYGVACLAILYIAGMTTANEDHKSFAFQGVYHPEPATHRPIVTIKRETAATARKSGHSNRQGGLGVIFGSSAS